MWIEHGRGLSFDQITTQTVKYKGHRFVLNSGGVIRVSLMSLTAYSVENLSQNFTSYVLI